MLGDIAVANGTYDLHHKVNSSEVDEKGVFTQVFERAHGGWLCINSQRTVLRENSNAKSKKQSTRRASVPYSAVLKERQDHSVANRQKSTVVSTTSKIGRPRSRF